MVVALLLGCFFLWDRFPFPIFWKFYWVTKRLHLFHLFIHVHMCLVCVCITYIPCSGKFRGVQFSRKGNLQRFRGLISADGHSRTATFLQNELLSIKAQLLQPLHSQQCVFLSEVRRKLLMVASFLSIRTLFGFDHSLHFCVSWFYGRRWHCRRQRATWIRKLGSITRRLKIA